MLAELGEEPSVLGVADRYAGLAGTLVIDVADRALADQVGERGLRCVVAETVMSSREVAVELARVVIAAGGA
jgi:LPPG:FO 2-phospho-L-lactate transferase